MKEFLGNMDALWLAGTLAQRQPPPNVSIPRLHIPQMFKGTPTAITRWSTLMRSLGGSLALTNQDFRPLFQPVIQHEYTSFRLFQRSGWA